MSRKDKMREETDCLETIFMSYINNKKKYEMFLFFEGKDDFKYYCPRIFNDCRNKEYIKYDCNGKENVIKIHSMLTKQTEKKNEIIKMFFMDRDYDDNLNISEEIYVTPTYSIENLYFTNKVLRDMLIGEMGLTMQYEEDKNDLNIALNYIIGFRDKIINDIIYGNAYYSLQIKKSHELGCTKPNLISIKKYDEIKNITTFEEIKNKVNNHIEVTEIEINEECERLRLNPIKFLRGKYLLEKMPKYINEIRGLQFSKKRIIRLNTSESKLISDLSNYAETPECLTKYIKKRSSVI